MASVLRIYVTQQDINVKLPDDDIEMSKHAGVYIIYRVTVVIYNGALVGYNKNSERCMVQALK